MNQFVTNLVCELVPEQAAVHHNIQDIFDRTNEINSSSGARVEATGASFEARKSEIMAAVTARYA